MKINGRAKRIRIAANIAITPPSLFGIDRKMAYAQRKYHSGLMWRGVTNGLAGMKFSGSPSKFGANSVRKVRALSITINPVRSFVV